MPIGSTGGGGMGDPSIDVGQGIASAAAGMSGPGNDGADRAYSSYDEELARIADAKLMALAAQKVNPELQGYHPTQVAQAFSNAMQGADIFGKYSTIGLISKILGHDPVQGAIEQTQKMLGMPGVSVMPGGLLSAPVPGGGTIDMGSFGQVTYSGMPVSDYTGAFSHLAQPKDEHFASDKPQIVPPTDTLMGKTCPDGYEFDDTLQACVRVSPGLQPAPFTPMQYRLPETGLLDFPVSNMGATLI